MGPLTAAEMAEAGEAAARDGDHAGAVVAFRKAVFLDPDHPVAWFQLGIALAALGRCDPGALQAGLDGWAADELAGVLRARLGRP